MAIRTAGKLFKDLIRQRVISTPIGPSRHCSYAATSAPKIPHSSKKGRRLLTGATIGLVIAGGAYVSTVDEATFCCCSWLGSKGGKLETSSTSSPSNDEAKHGGKAGPGILGVNLGKNKSSEDAAADYVQGVHTLSQYADYLVINVSSPNTPGLRMLQGRKQLKDLVKRVQAARDEMQWGEEGPPPLLVAIALRLDGLIISNTTISRPDPVDKNPVSAEAGGLSGKPLFDLSTNILKEMYMLTRGKIPLIGCGGISSGEDAYKKIRSGATLVQLYTAFAYGGPALIPRIKAELAECLERDGFKSIHEAVGADCR
ncbi:Dihydroorotate dehydrogenase (quinone) [Hibiscus syriacus]|uniref:Dihydroorotate dehydrogenase (quinone), mitochondrial n=1 Tax=Hibiscus syriacus TaxID=106335 RepID=A0A6A2XBS9_HIBSY|nr:Dihydroorotate dehydrogenase (quinone) [Hibiscus syriacus]